MLWLVVVRGAVTDWDVPMTRFVVIAVIVLVSGLVFLVVFVFGRCLLLVIGRRLVGLIWLRLIRLVKDVLSMVCVLLCITVLMIRCVGCLMCLTGVVLGYRCFECGCAY